MILASIFNSLDWQNVIAGAILGVILALCASGLVTVIKIRKRFFQDHYKGYYGEYYTYNWAVKGGNQISEKELTISRNWRGFPKAEIRINEDVVLTYRGIMRSNGRSLYIDLIGEGHAEELKLVYHEPLERKINLLIGIFAAITLDFDPFSGKLVISKNKLTSDEAKKLLGGRNLLVVDSKYQRNLAQHEERDLP